ncbi:hypothetical protein [Psychroflexus salis]|uniref:Uncharacterized protein n=1 Tax=Psychroflexus salis TaxID=1526574 RepID=A0A917E592_9FLAO|nr:hypothetical protein [Psychroflexus salis]GGE02210.1 hypothetical protein GCM10010831_00020 [Psychroflexus salis]
MIDGFALSETKLFEIKNIPTSEAFEITLEPEGSSETLNSEIYIYLEQCGVDKNTY